MAQARVDLVLRQDAALRDLVRVQLPRIVPAKHLNNDGSGNECSTDYDAGNFEVFCRFFTEICRRDPATARAALAAYPKIRAAFDFWPDIWCLQKYIPPIGDAGYPGSTSGLRGTPEAYLAMYDLTGTPQYAQVALQMVGGEPTALPRDIFAADPERLIERAADAARAAGSWKSTSVIKPDYGLGILPRGAGANEQDLWLTWSARRGVFSHGHFDTLSIGLYAFGVPMICPQGYPLYTGDWPARRAWTSHTRSHATVCVDGRNQKYCGTTRLIAFAQTPAARMIAAERLCLQGHFLLSAHPGNVGCFRIGKAHP